MNEMLRVLLVEDEPVDQLAFTRFVEREGLNYETVLADSIGKASSALSGQDFDVILVDYFLGADTGLELIRDIHDTPCILITGNGGEDIAVRAMKVGAADYISKDAYGDYLRNLPSVISNAIKTKRVEVEREFRLRELETIERVSNKMRQSQNETEMLNAFMDLVLEVLDTDSGSIWLYAAAEDVLQAKVLQGWFEHASNLTLKPGEGLAGWTHLLREPYFIREFINEPKARTMEFAHMPAGWGGVCVPILANSYAVGVLMVAVQLPRQIEVRELNLLKITSQITGTAIQQVSLYEETMRNVEALGTAYQSLMESWSRALDLRDHETEGHTRRVAEMTMQLARVLNYPEEKMGDLYRGAVLHDVGKIGIPDSVLLKPGKLTADEWELMKQHPKIAFDNLSSNQFLRSSLEIPYCHHERWDGSGYPRGLRSVEIPLSARIFSVLDVWDALMSDRPYRRAMSREEALTVIREQRGSQFDPHVVDAFLNFIEGSANA